jgi:hypothetical protein
VGEETITKSGLCVFKPAAYGSASWYAGYAMVEQASTIEFHQLYVRLCAIWPLIWRRLTAHSDSTVADLHSCDRRLSVRIGCAL